MKPKYCKECNAQVEHAPMGHTASYVANYYCPHCKTYKFSHNLKTTKED